MKTILLGIGVLFFIIMLYAAFISIYEKEKRAAIILFLLSIIIPLPYLFITVFSIPLQNEIGLSILGITFLVLCVLFFPVRKKKSNENIEINSIYDERDTIFARNKLIPGSEKFDAYYKMKPENKLLDDKFREKPGLMSTKSIYYDPLTFSSADASFRAVECFDQMINGEVSQEQVEINDQEITAYIKKWAIKLGALDIGITELKDYHLYSHKGRGESYGKPITNKHKYAIAFVVEMDKEKLSKAPYGTTLAESAQQYFNSGAIAVQVAHFIRNLGYSATAHIDANYELICPLVAMDAGLGEIGRMGLLMTPSLGPRVRISVVTTDIPLVCDKRKTDPTVVEFCRLCKKCANICPVNAIPFDDRQEIEGSLRWRINSETCFTYWCTVGTDCGQCMRICPYSHPDNLLHNFIRWGIKNNPVFRRLALWLDNLFYGLPKLKNHKLKVENYQKSKL